MGSYKSEPAAQSGEHMETIQKQTFEAALEDFIAEVNRVRNKNQERFSNLVQGTSYIDFTIGPKYTKLVAGDASSSGRSYYGFVRNQDGAVLYAGGPKPFIGKSEATTVRGNIYDSTTWAGCIGPYGVLTLSRR
jgi:hypothetical protein